MANFRKFQTKSLDLEFQYIGSMAKFNIKRLSSKLDIKYKEYNINNIKLQQ